MMFPGDGGDNELYGPGAASTSPRNEGLQQASCPECGAPICGAPSEHEAGCAWGEKRNAQLAHDMANAAA